MGIEVFFLLSCFVDPLYPVNRYQAVIANITKRMGDGMAEFLSKKAVTVQDYELYCHYVAGLVGHGLSKLFGESGLEGAPSVVRRLFDLT
jgi:farnesyl-diphosphate farnesyltransferase